MKNNIFQNSFIGNTNKLYALIIFKKAIFEYYFY